MFDVLFTSDLGSTWGGKSVTMRIKTTSQDSGHANASVYDQFTVTFHYLCADDNVSIAIANDIVDQSYTFNQGETALPQPAITHTTGCQVTFKLFAYYDTNNAWVDFSDASNPLASFISAFDPNTGIAKVTSTGTGVAPPSGSNWKPRTTVPMKIVATSVHSKTSLSQVSDEFSLTLSDTCGANKIALDLTTYANNNAGVAVSSFTYTINSTAVSKKPAISTVKTNAECPIQSKLYIFQASDSTWLDQTTPTSPYTDWIKTFNPATGELVVEKLGSYAAP